MTRRERAMLDHVGIPVSDYARSKGFYLRAFAPLGYDLVMEVSSEETGGESQAGFGAKGRPQFWIGSGKPIKGRVHFAFMAKDRAAVRRVLRRGAEGRRQGQRRAGAAPALSRQLLRRLRARPRRPQHRGGVPSARVMAARRFSDRRPAALS